MNSSTLIDLYPSMNYWFGVPDSLRNGVSDLNENELPEFFLSVRGLPKPTFEVRAGDVYYRVPDEGEEDRA